MDKMIWKQ